MQIKTSEFESYRNLAVISNNDSGVFCVEYGPDTIAPVPTFEKDSGDWYYKNTGDTYRVRIAKPSQRKVLRTAVIMRTSANHYEVAYADEFGCARTSEKTMCAVHEFLRPLWNRRSSK
ncbi:MAG: hypothetical protein NC099_03595 [Corallococcus sp.]|nr:hypothetical protein [Corallococcus sp.]